MKRAGLVAVCIVFVGCGSSTTAPRSAPSVADDEPICADPTGQQKAALRFAMRDRALLDAPWSLVFAGKARYMAAVVDPADVPGVSVRVSVLVRFPGGDLSRMRAVNGTARMYTDLPTHDTIPEQGDQALACVA